MVAVKQKAPVAISKVGKGKAAFIGDSSLVEDSSPKYVREDNGEKKKHMMVLKNKTTVSY